MPGTASLAHVSVGGHSLAYLRHEGRGPALVFLHEGLGSIRLWRDFPARVAEATGHTALVYDRYGYGDSDVLRDERVGKDFMHHEALVELPALLKALDVRDPILVGHSDGASIALIHAGGAHDVRGVVAMAPHLFVEAHGLASIRRIREGFVSTGLRDRLAKYHRDPSKTFHLWNDAWLDPAFRSWNIEEYVAGIRCPVLAIQGEGDEYGTMAQLDAIARQTGGPCELLKLADCGHAPFRDQPRAVLKAIAAFVGKIADA